MPWTAFRPNLGRKAASSPAAIPNVSPTPGQEASVADGPATSSRSFTARQRRRFVLRQPSVPEVKGGAAAPSPTAARHGQRRLALVPTNGQMQHHAARMKLSSAANDVVEACATASLEELKGKIDALTAAYDHAANGLSMEQREPQDMAAVITAALADYSPRASSSAPTNTQSLEDTPTPTDTSSSDQSSIEIAQAEHNACASSASPKSSKWKGLKLAASLAAKGGSNTPAPDTSANADANKWKNSLRSLASGKNLGSFVGIRRHSLISPRSSLAEPLLAAHYNPETSPVTAFLIDLDGTMYDPAGLLPGAASFYRWLVESGTPHVFLSNTGAKNATAVQKKFSTPPYVLSSTREHVPLKNIMTAGEAQVDYMLDVIPPGAKILVISGGDGAWRRDLDNRGGDAGKELAASWEIRTHLGDAEAKAWATISARSRGISSSKPVWVVFFTDGDIRGQQDAVTGDSGFGDWGFEVIKISSFLLNHGAQFVYTADDAFNPCVDPEYPGLVFPLPGPGMFASMLLKLMYPHSKQRVACAGKGGNVGDKYMMERARQMLIAQGHSGEPHTIMMVGDRFDTDVRAGLSAGFLTCLVTSGCHPTELQRFYRTDPAHYYATGVGELAPRKMLDAQSPKHDVNVALPMPETLPPPAATVERFDATVTA